MLYTKKHIGLGDSSGQSELASQKALGSTASTRKGEEEGEEEEGKEEEGKEDDKE